MIKEPIEKFHCYGNNEIYNKYYCEEEKCKFLQACAIWSGYPVVDMAQWKVIDAIHHNMTSGEVMETLQENFKISYNAAKMSVKRWRKRKNDKD
jgi:hypothetical protein